MATDANQDEPSSASERDETPAERLDRNYVELLQELRVVQTGVQILFAFLLSLPFLQGFHIDQPDRKWVYSITLLAASETGFGPKRQPNGRTGPDRPSAFSDRSAVPGVR